eukprot:maker-scaffold575_size133042-snap-gene-0.36 protein:Tk10160 transcript:maker-scaffold575_size133042-snap-gene-0.36-mRNA-1 annotation:"metallophosphoesterase 1 isoform x1"
MRAWTRWGRGQRSARLAPVVWRTLVGLSLLLLWCEFLVYYVTLSGCHYPAVPASGGADDPPLRAMVLADTHLLGSRHGHWFDQLRREWQMHRAFQSAYALFQPELVLFLGDLFDEGQWCGPPEFNAYVQRFQDLFAVDPERTTVKVVAGNHDIGFHYAVTPESNRRFEAAFRTPAIDQFALRGVHFVSVNSMAMEGDRCFLCTRARQQLHRVASHLGCWDPDRACEVATDGLGRIRPILLQHFPLFRASDTHCQEIDEAPAQEKDKPFRERWDCLSREASQELLTVLKPRLILSGHTHHGCRTHHGNVTEWSVSSFSWRNRNNPTFLLAHFTPDTVAIEKCVLPTESSVVRCYIVGGLIWLVFPVSVMSADEELPSLSAETFAALQQFYSEEDSRDQARQDVQAESSECVDYQNIQFSEDWQLSQFWYDERTSKVLADECLSIAQASPKGIMVLLEHDKRFARFGGDFQFYDYKSPLDVPREWREHFDLVVADPPFLSDECLTKTAVTIKFLSSEKIILCTGALMGDMAERLLQLKAQEFKPTHRNNLANEFRCYANYTMSGINL